MRAARGVLLALGVAGLIVGAWLLVTTVKPAGLVGLVVWFAAAVILHDAILSPVLVVAGRTLRRRRGRLPLAAIAVVQVAALVGGVCTLLLLPAIHAKQLGVRNPSVLPLDYAAHLAGLWIVLVIAAAVGVAIVLRVASRRATAAASR